MVERCWNFPKNFMVRDEKISIGFYRNVVFTQKSQMRIVPKWRRLVNPRIAKVRKGVFQKVNPQTPRITKNNLYFVKSHGSH